MKAEAALPHRQRLSSALISSTFINIATKLFIYLRYVSIGIILGYQLGTDAFFVALGLISVLLIFVDAFDSFGIPMLIEAKTKGEETYSKLISTLLTFTVLSGVFFSLLIFVAVSLLDKLPLGFDATERVVIENMLLLLAPFVFFSFLFCCFGAICRAGRKFHFQFFGELLASFVSFILTVVLLKVYKNPYVVPISMSIGALISTLYIVKVAKVGIRFRWSPDSEFFRIFKGFLLVSALHGVAQLLIFTDKLFASYLPNNAVSALSYASMVAMLPRNVLRLENIFITPIAENRAEPGQMRLYTMAIILLTVPVAVFVSINAKTFVSLMFGYGAINQGNVQVTAQVTAALALSLPFIFLWLIYYRALQVLGQLRSASIILIASFIVNVIANYVFIFVMKIGIIGLPLGTLIAYVVLVLASQQLLWHSGHLADMAQINLCFLSSLAVFGSIGYALLRYRSEIIYLDVVVQAFFLTMGAVLLYFLTRTDKLYPPRNFIRKT